MLRSAFKVQAILNLPRFCFPLSSLISSVQFQAVSKSATDVWMAWALSSLSCADVFLIHLCKISGQFAIPFFCPSQDYNLRLTEPLVFPVHCHLNSFASQFMCLLSRFLLDDNTGCVLIQIKTSPLDTKLLVLCVALHWQHHHADLAEMRDGSSFRRKCHRTSMLL